MSLSSEKMTEQVQRAIQSAQETATLRGNCNVTPIHLGYALFKDPQGLALQVVRKLNASHDAIMQGFEDALRAFPSQSPPPDHIPLDGTLRKILIEAVDDAQKAKEAYLAADRLLEKLAKESKMAPILSQGGTTANIFVNELKALRKSAGGGAQSSSSDDNLDNLSKYATDLVAQAAEGKLDPVIGRVDEINRVIRILARRTKNNPCLVGAPGVGKTAIVEGLAQRIVRGDVPRCIQDTKVFSLDMGALVAGAKFRGEFEERLKSVLNEVKEAEGKIIVFIDEVHLVLGAGKTDGAMDAANLLKPSLARGELRCIGATTTEEHRKYIEKDSALERRFQRVDVSEPSVADTVSILRGLKERYEAHHGVLVTDDAVVAAATLADRYISGRYNPDKAIDLIDEACATVRMQLDSRPVIIDTLERRKLQLEIEKHALEREKKSRTASDRLQDVLKELREIEDKLKPLLMRYEAENKRVGELAAAKQKLEDLQNKAAAAERRREMARAADLRYGAIPEMRKKIDDLERAIQEEKNKPRSPDSEPMVPDTVGFQEIAVIIERWTGIPADRLSQTEAEKILHLADRLKKRVIGQDTAVEAVARIVARSKVGLATPGKPLGSFLFCGPTGVGKTELAKTLACELFDSEKHMIRIDMSEYMEQHSVARLIGAPPGYIGHDEGGQLTEAVRRQPYNVLLLDEIEKAHRDVCNVLLQVLDDGVLTDSKGRHVNFANTIIIMTSNLGFFGNPSATPAEIGAAIRRHFRPEFINRIDEQVFFNSLSRENLHDIVANEISKISKMLVDRRIAVSLTRSAVEAVVRESYDPTYGVRPLKRFLDKELLGTITDMLLSGSLFSDAELIVSTTANGALSYQVKTKDAPPHLKKLRQDSPLIPSPMVS